MEELDKLVKQGSKYGLVEAELAVQELSEVKFEKNKFKNANSGTLINLGVRVTNGLKQGYAQTSNLKKWKHCLMNAVKLMKASNPLLAEPELSSDKGFAKIKADKKLINTSINDLIKSSKIAVSACTKFNGVNVASCIANKSINKIYFINSKGVNSSYDSGLIEFSIDCNKGSSRGWDIKTSTTSIDFYKSGRAAAELCIKSVNPIAIKTCKKPVVLDFYAAEGLIDLLAYNLFADSVLEDRSFFKGKTGQKVLSEKLSIIDDGLLNQGLGSRPFDTEGVKTKRTVLINKGFLKGFLHDKYTAKRMNTKSTGNCNSLAKRPSINFNNLVVKHGSASNDELMNNCVFIPYFLGLHTINFISGDFSISPNNAFLIKKGVWTPLKNFMISGNLFELFNNIELIGKKQRQDTKIKTPLIRFKDVQLIG